MKYTMEYQKSFVQKICENLWKADIHPYWQVRKRSKILEVVRRVCPYILLNVPIFLLISIYQYLWLIYILAFVGIWLIVRTIIMVVFSYDEEIIEYWKWYQKMDVWMKKSKYRISISDESLEVSIYGKTVKWKWDHVKWYRAYPQILLIYAGKVPIYIDLKMMNGEERMKLRNLLQVHASLNQKEQLTRQFHLSAMKEMGKGIKNLSNKIDLPD